MRLFIAFDISKEAVLECLRVQKLLKGARFSFVDSFHQTLKFLGEVEPSVVPQIIDRLNSVRFESFEVSLFVIGCFPSKSSTRVVWMGLSPKNVVCDFQRVIDASLRGIFVPDKSFEPHVTLARVKELIDEVAFNSSLDSLKVAQFKFRVESFRLIESKLTSKGSEYYDIHTFSLSKPL